LIVFVRKIVFDTSGRRNGSTVVKFALHPTRCGVLNHCFKLFNRVGFSDDAREIGDFGGISSVFDPYGHWIPHDDYL